MKLDEELDREQDIEELRRLARALHAQNQQLMEALTAKSREVERLRGKPGDLQLTLKMLEMPISSFEIPPLLSSLPPPA